MKYIFVTANRNRDNLVPRVISFSTRTAQYWGSLSNDHCDGNENGKKAIGLDWQNNNFARASRYLYIS